MQSAIFVSSIAVVSSVAAASSITYFGASGAFATAAGGVPALWDTTGFADGAVTALNDVDFTGVPGGSVDISRVTSGSFYAGIVSGMASNWQQNLGNLTLSSDVIAFGYSPYATHAVDMQFDPGITALGFDIAEIESSSTEIIVTLSDGTVVNATDQVGGLGNGFFGFVITGAYVDGVTILNTGSEGILLGNFQTSFVPLPSAAWGALGLGGLGLMIRSIRRKA